MQIEFLFYADCPSHDEALERLQTTLAELGLPPPIQITEVTSYEQAQAEGFIGSPTIRINGRDIVPPNPDATFGLTCRVYTRADGRPTPLPPAEIIRAALQAAQPTQGV